MLTVRGCRNGCRFTACRSRANTYASREIDTQGYNASVQLHTLLKEGFLVVCRINGGIRLLSLYYAPVSRDKQFELRSSREYAK